MKENHETGTLASYGVELAAVLQAMGHPHRIKILAVLTREEAQFSSLQEETGLGKTALSHHLTTLADAGLITPAARGTYRITADGESLLNATADAFAASRMKRDKEQERRADLILRVYRGETTMNKPEVKIVKLTAMRIVAFTKVSESPESEAFNALSKWAKAKDYGDMEKYPVYGFERPDLYQGNKRAYTFWLSVPKSYKGEAADEVIDVPGSTYVVTTCATKGDPFRTIPQAWERLVEWVKKNGYTMKSGTPCLEKHIIGKGDDFVLELHLPIEA